MREWLLEFMSPGKKKSTQERPELGFLLYHFYSLVERLLISNSLSSHNFLHVGYLLHDLLEIERCG